jgi:hypothetical protein
MFFSEAVRCHPSRVATDWDTSATGTAAATPSAITRRFAPMTPAQRSVRTHSPLVVSRSFRWLKDRPFGLLMLSDTPARIARRRITKAHRE